jgi:CRP-like cAMP-binding protein
LSDKTKYVLNTDSSLIKLIRSKGQLRKFDRGEFLYFKNSSKKFAILLESGFTALYHNDKNSKIIRFVQPGEVLFSELAMNPSTEQFDWKSFSKSYAYFLEIETLKKKIHQSELQLELLQIAAKNMGKISSNAANRINLPLKYQFFLFFEEILQIVSSNEKSIAPINRSHLINYFGCSKSSLSRIFGFFIEKSIIVEEKEGLYINQMLLQSIRQKGEMP